MNIRFQLDFDDLVAFQLDVIKHSYTHRVKGNYFKWVTSIVLFAVILFLFHLSPTTIAAGLVITIIYFYFSPKLYTNMALSKLKKQMQRNDYSHILGHCEMNFSENGIDRIIKDEMTHFDWNGFEDLREDRQHFFLYVSDLQGLILPKKTDGMDDEKSAAYHDLIVQRAAKFSSNS